MKYICINCIENNKVNYVRFDDEYDYKMHLKYKHDIFNYAVINYLVQLSAVKPKCSKCEGSITERCCRCGAKFNFVNNMDIICDRHKQMSFSEHHHVVCPDTIVAKVMII